MKVTGYRVLRTFREWGRPIGDVNGHIASGITEEAVVLVDTDAGITGVGTGHVADLARLFPAIEGQDPRAVTALYDRMLARVFKAGHAGATFGSIGAFDMALWDIKAKAAGEPLWRLLGGRDRFVTGYASGLDIALSDEELAAFYAQMADLGFSSGKLKGGRDLDADRRRLHIVRDAMGRNSRRPAVMFDANESWNLKQAVRYISELERDIDLTWVEEPLRRWDAEGHARLSRSIRAAVATGENLSGLEQFRPIMDAGGVDVVQVGCTWGVTHFLRVAILAHGRDLPISPVGVTANQAVAHAALAVPEPPERRGAGPRSTVRSADRPALRRRRHRPRRHSRTRRERRRGPHRRGRRPRGELARRRRAARAPRPRGTPARARSRPRRAARRPDHARLG
ncbi:mandelate racemase/muconate lactonizing enzyme family protein [Microbacterium sp. SLBN-111]